jgi:retinoid hydroxylase
MRGVVEEIEFDGYLIPAGWNVIIMPLLTHRLPEIYAEPDRFDPDRFAPPREEDIKYPYSLIGFGGGVHSCIGVEFAKMEMKLILAALLDRFDWTTVPLPATDYPVRRPVQLQPTLTIKLVPLKTRSLVE